MGRISREAAAGEGFARMAGPKAGPKAGPGRRPGRRRPDEEACQKGIATFSPLSQRARKILLAFGKLCTFRSLILHPPL